MEKNPCTAIYIKPMKNLRFTTLLGTTVTWLRVVQVGSLSEITLECQIFPLLKSTHFTEAGHQGGLQTPEPVDLGLV